MGSMHFATTAIGIGILLTDMWLEGHPAVESQQPKNIVLVFSESSDLSRVTVDI